MAEAYAYDANGNRTQTRVPLRGIDTTLTSSFDTEDRATTVGDATYTYTPGGYLAFKHSQEGTTTYTYSAFGELAQATLPDGTSVSYTYDASGRRTSKAIDGTATERYLWADATRLLAVYDADGTVLMRFLYADARVPYAADTQDGRIYLAYDQTGSLRTVSAEDGSVLKTVMCDSFGNVIEDSDPTLEVPLGFAGGMHDADTSLTLFGARDYDPTLGRWLAKDPIGFAGGDANLYGYCLGDPVNLVDPSGLVDSSSPFYINETIARRAAEAAEDLIDFVAPAPDRDVGPHDGSRFGVRNADLRRTDPLSDCPEEDLWRWLEDTAWMIAGEIPGLLGWLADAAHHTRVRGKWIAGDATYGDLTAAKVGIIPGYSFVQYGVDSVLAVSSGPYPDGSYSPRPSFYVGGPQQ